MSEQLIKRLIEERANVWEQAKAHLEAVEKEGREFTGEAKEAYSKLTERMDSLDERIEELDKAEQRAKEADEVASRYAAARPERHDDDKPSLRAQVRSFLRGDVRSLEFAPPTDEDRDREARGREARTGLVVGTDTAGGDTVPTDFYGRLVEHMIEVSGILAAGPTVLNTAGGEPIEIPVTTTHPSAEQGAENTAMNESDPVFGQRTLNAYKYDDLVQVSRELIDDTAVDLLGYLARACGRAVGNKIGVDLITGDGSSKPTGVVTSSTLGVTGTAGTGTGEFTADDLIDLEYSVIEPYTASPSCAFLLRRASAGKMRKLKDDNGQYLWSPSLIQGRPNQFDGFPVRTDPNVAAVATSAKSVLFGDFAAYFVRFAGPIRFERSDEYAFNKDMVTFRCILRGDGILADQTGAVKHFVGKSS